MMAKLENVKLQLKLKYTIDEEAIEALKHYRLTENEIRDTMLESRYEDLVAALKEELSRAQRNYNYEFSNIHIDVEYPITDVYFDVESANSQDESEKTIIENITNVLTEYEHVVYARFPELNDSAAAFVVFDPIESEA